MPSPLQKLGAYARLLRLSNGPTAIADVWMGYAVATGELTPSWPLTWVTLGSLMLYHGGMAHNDVRDARRDREQQRQRPIAQGLVSHRIANGLARLLLLLGMIIATCGIAFTDSTRLGRFALLPICLLVTIVAYNGRLKRTALAPLLMGLCRYQNVLLGFAAAASSEVYLANRIEYAFKGICLYVLGVTVFARDESRGDRRDLLWGGLAFALVGVLLMAFAPRFYLDSQENAVPASFGLPIWWLTWGAVALVATRGMVAAILQPTPQKIGRGVGIAIQGLVVIDAVLAAFYAGPVAGLAILALLPVTIILSQWIPQS